MKPRDNILALWHSMAVVALAHLGLPDSSVGPIQSTTVHERNSMDTIESLTVERDQARAFSEEAAKKYNDLLASNRVTCAYCGHQYADGTPEAKSAALTEHIAKCKDHPMRQLGAALCALMSIPFPPTYDALKEMRLGIAAVGMQAGSGADVRNAFAALDALRVFLPNT